VTYVWFDALLNYVTFAGYLAEPGSNLPNFADLWPCQAHLIGKDIMVPAHGVYWPIMLHAMGFPDDQMPRLTVHGWWNVEGAKMSKSVGNVVDPFQLAEQFGADAVRYYLMRDIATGHDADFSVDRLLIRYHSDLANGIGNLVNRTINMVQRYHSGLTKRIDTLDPEIEAIKTTASSVLSRYQDAFAQFQPHAALEAVSDLVTQANGLVELKAPWKLAKDPAQTQLLHDVLYTLAETSRFVAALMEPVIPKSAQKILEQLNASDNREPTWGKLPAEHQLGEPTPVFPRFDDR
jgi:methionyl-tRNA synthetase